MQSRRRFDIKLIDFGRARKITSYEGEKVPRLGTAEFMGMSSHKQTTLIYVAKAIWSVPAFRGNN